MIKGERGLKDARSGRTSPFTVHKTFEGGEALYVVSTPSGVAEYSDTTVGAMRTPIGIVV
jgi:hypothetical protein